MKFFLIFMLMCVSSLFTFSQTTLWSTGFETGNSVPTYSLTTGVSLGLSTTGGNNAAYCGKIVANGSPSKTYDGSIITNNTISFTTGKYYVITVYSKIATATGKLQIMKSTTNTNAAMKSATGSDIIMTSASNNVTSTSYVKYTVGFTVTSNETKYVGFQMTQTATASANMFLDDIKIEEFSDPQCENYCKPTSAGSTTGHITNVTFNTINRNSTYDGYVCTGNGTSIERASSYNLSVTKTTTYPASIYSWVDWDKDGTFETSELVVSNTSNSTATQSTSVTVPSDATIGNTKMRVMFKYNATPTGPCDATNTYYDVEDYDITITPQPACSGTPNPGNTLSTTNPACNNQSITLSLQNQTPGTGVQYQWQSSTNNSSWTNESSTTNTLTTTITSNKYFRCGVTCGGVTTYSNSIYITVGLNVTCYSSVSSTTDDATGLTEVIFNTINNPTNGSPAYTDYTETYSTSVTKGDIYQISIKVNTNGNYTVFAKAWIDWDQNGVYNTTNEEYNLGSVKNVTSAATSLSPLLITIPNDALVGTTFMRIRATYNVAPTSSGNQNYSEAEDYKLILSESVPLPVELTQFEATPYPQWNVVKWTTVSEQNSSHFDLEMSTDGEEWRKITTKQAAGNSTEEVRYSYIDYNLNSVTYYRLLQFDIDGKFETYGPIIVTKTITEKKIVKYINLMGQEVNPEYTKGVVIEIYDDGTIKKMIR